MKLWDFSKYFAKAEELAVDPVCQMRVLRSERLKIDFTGETYYFCSENCQENFKQNPKAFIKDS